jgi:hypothetical protein
LVLFKPSLRSTCEVIEPIRATKIICSILGNDYDIIDLIIPTPERQTASLVEDETIIQFGIDAAWF